MDRNEEPLRSNAIINGENLRTGITAEIIDDLKKKLKSQNIVNWAYIISSSNRGQYQYPASMDEAIIDQQSYLLQPDNNFLKKNILKTKDGRPINKEKFNPFTVNYYKLVGPSVGLSIPLYFTLIKLCFTLLVMIQCIYGIYYFMEGDNICDKDSTLDCDKTDYAYYLISADDFVSRLGKSELWKYYLLSSFTFGVILLTPFILETVMRFVQIKYWHENLENYYHKESKSLYVKHLSGKIPEKILQELILKKVKQSTNVDLDLFQGDFIVDLVNIQDISHIQEYNNTRKTIFLELLKVANKIKDLTKNIEMQENNENPQQNDQPLIECQKNLVELIVELMIETSMIQQYLIQGLPFNNKMLLKMTTDQQADIVLKAFKRPFHDALKSKFSFIYRLRKYQIEQRKKLQILEETNQNESLDVEAENIPTDRKLTNSAPKKTIKDIIDNNFITQAAYLRVAEERNQAIKKHEEHEAFKTMHVGRGFKNADISWVNLGTDSLRRFTLSVITLTITIIMSTLCMLIFEMIFYYENQPSMKQKQRDNEFSVGQKIFIIILGGAIVILSVIATLTVLIMTVKSRRSTYTQQEHNIITFNTLQQMIFILSFPFILVLMFWNGLDDTVPIYDLIIICRARIVAKAILSIFHVRLIRSWCMRRKIRKNFLPTDYFQSQLNQLLRPPQFPIRSRLYMIYFALNMGYLMVYLAPSFIFWALSILFIFFFFDKYQVSRVYSIQKEFSFTLSRYLTRSICTVMTPVHIFIFYLIFRERSNSKYGQIIDVDYLAIIAWSVGIPLWLCYVFFKEVIVDFILFKIFCLKKPTPIDESQMLNKTYYESYIDNYDSMGIEQLSEILNKNFSKLELNIGEE